MADLGYHILLEKPLSTTWQSTQAIINAVRGANKIFAVGHVLRYSPFNILLKRLLSEEKVIGKIMNLQHTERVGWWHFAHSYVRGNWRNSGKNADGEATEMGAPSLLTKSCHDIDLIFWFLNEARSATTTQSAVTGSGSGLDGGNNHSSSTEKDRIPTSGKLPDTTNVPVSVYSSGSLSVFKRDQKPEGAGTYCLECPIEANCLYSAKRIYLAHALDNPQRSTKWPISVLVPDIEDHPSPRDAVLAKLAPNSDNLYGRCVWDIPDNDVCDNQSVTFNFPHGVIATFNMVAFTGAICKRHTIIYGTHGELHADAALKKIVVHTFEDDQKREYRPEGSGPGSVKDAHGGGDVGLIKAFLESVWLVERQDWDTKEAQLKGLGVDLDEIEMSHQGIWLAEESREKGEIIPWH